MSESKECDLIEPKRIEREIIRILSGRAAGKTMCPSESISPRLRRDPICRNTVRKVAARMSRRGIIDVLQKGREVAIEKVKGPIRLRLAKFKPAFETDGIDFRKHPRKYRVAKGEQGVLGVEPYKSEILPHWKFKTPEIAKRSSLKIWKLFKSYRDEGDLVGMDMARKFLQMGYTRSRRYANHRSGRKYMGAVPERLKGRSGAHGRVQASRDPDTEKAQSAEIFRKVWQRAERDRVYKKAKSAWKSRYG